jgi:hypothetical protein
VYSTYTPLVTSIYLPRSTDTLHLEATTLKREAEHGKAGRKSDVRSLATYLSSGIKFMEWANSFRSGGELACAEDWL